MPRQARIDAPGALQHIIIRGIERKAIFKNGADRQDFIDRLGKLLHDTETACYAWALMTNHVHLLLRTGKTTISTTMRRLLTGYAVSFNRRHRRHGHLFQNRYKSILCEECSLAGISAARRWLLTMSDGANGAGDCPDEAVRANAKCLCGGERECGERAHAQRPID